MPYLLLSIFTLLASFSLNVQADYAERDDVKQFAQDFSEKFERESDEVMAILQQGKKKQSILDAISRPAERVLTWGDYRNIFIEEQRFLKGIEFWHEHRESLEKVSAEYGVPPEMVLAIMGVETRYGRLTGKYRVLDALMTLGFDYPPRSRFFLGQLEQFLLMTDEQNLNPADLKGSYAGAMGYGQFISGSYRAYAVDYDKDGVADIWQNPIDAIASVANYFARHHWQENEPVAYQLKDQNIAENLISKSRKPDTTVGALRKAGVSIPAQFDDSAKVILMKLETARGSEYWLGFHNFYVITRYNHSILYAMSAHQLSQLLRFSVDMNR